MKILRQAIRTTPSELREMADKLEKQISEINKDLGLKIKKKDIKFKSFVVPIINRQKIKDKQYMSDTWEFEK